jgi:hypothetical protein
MPKLSSGRRSQKERPGYVDSEPAIVIWEIGKIKVAATKPADFFARSPASESQALITGGKRPETAIRGTRKAAN